MQGILKRFKKLTDEWSDENLALGYPLNNLTQEMSVVDPLFREKLALTTVIRETASCRARKRVEGSCDLAGNCPERIVRRSVS